MFKKTSFGHFLEVFDIHFQTQLAQLVLLREVSHEREEEEMWFKLGRRVCRFFVEQFALVTDLKCDGVFYLSLFQKKKVMFKKKNI